VWSVQELEHHTGSDNSKALLLAILGEVYDVGTGEQYYAPGKGYAGAAGFDRSEAFHSGDFATGSSRISHLDPSSALDVLQWRNFYRTHKSYRFVGFLNELYYDADGRPTAELAAVESLERQGKQQEILEKDLEKRFKSCNTRSGQNRPHIEIWCDDSYHIPGSTPVHMHFELPSQGDKVPAKSGQKCVCLPPGHRAAIEKEQEVARVRQGSSKTSPSMRFVDYPDCAPGEQRCLRPKGSSAPK